MDMVNAIQILDVDVNISELKYICERHDSNYSPSLL